MMIWPLLGALAMGLAFLAFQEAEARARQKRFEMDVQRAHDSLLSRVEHPGWNAEAEIAALVRSMSPEQLAHLRMSFTPAQFAALSRIVDAALVAPATMPPVSIIVPRYPPPSTNDRLATTIAKIEKGSYR